jgi:hypothetical protein
MAFLAGVVCSYAKVSQASVPLPTRFAIGDRVPDFTVFEDLDLNSATFHHTVTGDFNGDGISDLLITNSLGLGSAARVGKASVILGASSLGLRKDINLATEQTDLTILGPVQFSQLGISATAGDLNGDGIDDIVLSATSVRAPGGRQTGAVYVIFGSRVFSSRVIDLANSGADVTVFGAAFSERLDPGLAVADINADGAKDLIFRQSPEVVFPNLGPLATHFVKDSTVMQAADEAEKVSILMGPFRTNSTFDLATTQPDVVVSRGGAVGLFGYAIAAGDVNGDGASDLVIGTPNLGPGGYAGIVDVISGSPELRKGVTISLSQTPPVATILGAAGDGLGRVLAIGDINSDGIEDIIIGAPDASRFGNGLGSTSAGVTYVVFGSRTLATRFVDASLAQQDLTIFGTGATEPNSTELGDRLGASLIAQDIDRDGVMDLLIGAPGAQGGKDFGQAYIVLGSEELLSGGVINTAESEQDITIRGAEKRDYLGTLVASGDLNGDGFSDLILEASGVRNSANQQASGAIYVYFGANVRPPEITKAKFKEGKSLLQIIGTDLTGSVRIEINGVIINREVTFFADEGRLVLEGTRQQLNLRSDLNQVVVIRKGTRSNVARVKG